MEEHYIRSGQSLLRCGYTTGTCAALAAGAAAELLLAGTESDCTVTCTQEEGAVEFTSENY